MPTITTIDKSSSTANTGAQSQNAQSARDRAVAKFMQGGQQAPVQNPNQVSPEELGAIRAPQGQSSHSEETSPANQVETPAQAAQPAKQAEEPAISSQYAVLARKEKAFRQKVQQQEAALRAEKEAIEKAKSELKSKEVDYQTNYIPKNRLTEDTIGTLLEAGISYDQITQLMLSQPTQQDPATKLAIARLEAKLNSQNETIENARKAAEESQKNQYKEAVKQISREAKELVRLDPQYEAIRETGSIGDVVELIEKTFNEEGYLLTVEDAAREVEEHLVEQLSKYTRKINKLRQKFNPQPKAAPASQSAQSPAKQQSQPAKTLTNALGASGKLSARERAVLAFKGELK